MDERTTNGDAVTLAWLVVHIEEQRQEAELRRRVENRLARFGNARLGPGLAA